MGDDDRHRWDPERYLTYADERGRPFLELIARVPAIAPARVVDLGCGPGNLTRLLAERWPAAGVIGVDSSPEMIERARTIHGIDWRVADARAWATDEDEPPVDVLVSNAMLQWVPDHLELLAGLAARVTPGGWFAFQVPGNFAEPSHELRRRLADEEPYRRHTRNVATPASHAAETYFDALAELGCAVDAWETTYLHVLRGAEPVFTWVSGTGARPTLEALDPVGLREPFEAELRARLAVAYPRRGDGTVLLPFRRIFVVARLPGA